MSDIDIRNLERDVKTSPDDESLKIKLFNARVRVSGQEFVTYWKVRDKKSGNFSNGRLTAHYSYNNPNDFFSKDGKEWFKKEDLYKFVKKGIEKKQVGLSEKLKNSEIIEYQTLTLSQTISNIEDEMNQFELDILRMEKESNLKRMKELEAKEQKLMKAVEKKEKKNQVEENPKSNSARVRISETELEDERSEG